MDKIKFYLHALYNDNLTQQNYHYLFTFFKKKMLSEISPAKYIFPTLYAFSLRGTENKML